MKKEIKYSLAKYGLFSNLDLLRQLLQIITWLRHGSRGIAPSPIKRMVLASYLKDYGIQHFVETGTHHGDTLAYIAHDTSIHAVSIELDHACYRAAVRRFATWNNVTLLHGDSGALMPKVVDSMTAPALFWLDGHYSGDSTAKGEKNTPVSAELQAILRSAVAGHVILIDDVRCFDGTLDYPHLDELLATIRADGRYAVEVSGDIIRLTPKIVDMST
jgi:hypothetical protein